MIFVLSSLSALLIFYGVYEVLTSRRKRIEKVILGERERITFNLSKERVKTVMWVIVYAALFFIGGWFLINGVLWGILMAIVGGFIPLVQTKERYEKQVRQLEKELEEALYQGTNVLRGGGGLYQFLEYLASDKTGDKIRPYFGSAFSQVRDLGISPVEAFQKLSDELPELKDLEMLAAAFEEAQENGADMSDVAEMFAEDVRNRRMLREEVVAKTTQGKMTAMMLLGIGLGVPAILRLFSEITDNPTLAGVERIYRCRPND